jgi:hypothetical protein
LAITFQLSPVERAAAPLVLSPRDAPLTLQGRAVEAMGASAPFLPSAGHGLLHAVAVAYAEHRPLALSPDAIWLAIAQGFAMHIHANAERLRGKFVRHEGQQLLQIERHDFVKGSPDNAWPEVFGAFSDQIAAHIGRQRDLVACDFSTTGPVERAASEIVLMDAMQRYFHYEVLTLCGIPEITLEGTVDDWRSVRRRAQALDEYELGFWTNALAPVLDELVATAEGRVDTAFWETLFKPVGGSGGPYVQGWINVLFPYLRVGDDAKIESNRSLMTWRQGVGATLGGGPCEAHIPSGLSSVPFVWDCLGARYPMRLLGGFVGIGQDEGSLTVRPVIGWAVRDDPPARPWPRSIALVAGRMTDPEERTQAEIDEMIARVEALGPSLGVELACAPAWRFERAPDGEDPKVKCAFAIGVRACAADLVAAQYAEVDVALEAARAFSPDVWQRVGERFARPLSAAVGLHLVIAGASVEVILYFGNGSELASAQVARIGTRGGVHQPIDMSPAAHAKRVSWVSDGRYWILPR